MNRFIADIKRDLADHPARSAWDKGCREYAVELFDDYLDRNHISGDLTRIGKLVERDLLNGADNWTQYSFGGCALIYDGDICERLCTPKAAERLKYGERKPTMHDSWLDAQAAALKQAARLVLRTVNTRR